MLRRGIGFVDRLLHIGGGNRNEGLPVGFRQRIGSLLFGTDQFRIGHRLAGLDVFDVTFGGDRQILGYHSGTVRNAFTHRIRQLRLRIIGHDGLR